MRTVRQTREDRHNRYALPMVRGIGASGCTIPARMIALTEIAGPAIMGGVWALPAPIVDAR